MSTRTEELLAIMTDALTGSKAADAVVPTPERQHLIFQMPMLANTAAEMPLAA